ncbi:MAG: radical SAM protein [Candidatus Omnitrophica bacterium]|nr:radical SAM protein [Candidatus Omnitrophota bacterium]MBU1869948.1 radical SAM protein [Candidatus Omnitrophota bacterium]
MKNNLIKLSLLRKNFYFILNGLYPWSHPLTNKIKLRLLKPINIKYIQISLTYDCQCSCAHCGMSKYNTSQEKLKPRYIYKIINNIVPNGFGQIDFFGGEPLLDENIYQYVKYSSARGIFTHINTNGLKLKEDNVRRLAKSGLRAISISFDSPNPEIHNKNRGINESFQRALIGAQLCIKNGIKTIMSIYSSPNDIVNGQTEELINIAKEYKFDSVRLLGTFKVGNLSSVDDPKYPDKAIKILKKIIKDNPMVKPHGIWKCFVPYRTVAYISPYGDVQPCSMVPFKFGNIGIESFSSILKRMYKHPLYDISEPGCIMNSGMVKKAFYDNADCRKQNLPIPIEQLVFSQEKD